jgi:hypothetical protein
MPKYIALRDCFDRDRYHNVGQVYEIPDGVKVHPKNFKLVDTPMPTTDNAPPPVVAEVPPAEQVVEPPKYVCSVCGKVVSTAGALNGHSRSHKGVKNVSTN